MPPQDILQMEVLSSGISILTSFFVVFCKVFILITDVFKLFFAVVNPSFQSQTGRSLSLLLHHGHFEKS